MMIRELKAQKSRQLSVLFGRTSLRLALLGGLSFLALDVGVAHAQTVTTEPAAPASQTAAAATDASVAQDAQAITADDEISAVVVTAQRREERLQSVPISVTAITGEAIRRGNDIHLAHDVISYVPNANAAATDGRDRPRWFIRGVGTNNTDANGVSPVGVYRDEVYIANFYAQAFPLFDQQRVEVLSGPQGTLWGKNTTGGAISYLSRAPSFAPDAYIKTSVGSDNERDIEGALGGTIIPGRVSGRISVYSEGSDGWFKNLYKADVTTPNSTGWRLQDAKRVGANNDDAWRGQLLFTINDTSEVLVSYHGRRYSGDQTPSYILPDPYVAPLGTPTYNLGYTSPANPLPYGYVWASGNSVETIENDGGLIRARSQIGNLDFVSVTGYEKNTLIRSSRGSGTIPLSNAVSRQETPDTQWSQEFRVSSPATDRFNWIAGAYAFNERTVSESWAGNLTAFAAPSPVTATSYTDNYTLTDTRTYALFGSATYNLTDNFKITGGLRGNYETKKFGQQYTLGTGTVAFSNPDQWWYNSSVSSPLVVNSIDRKEKTWRALTWDVTPQYKVNDHFLAYFHYARGFLSGGFDNRRIQPTGTPTPPAQLAIYSYEPERINTYEYGLKTQWLDNRLTVNFSSFYYDYPSIQVLVILPTTGSNANSSSLTNSGYSNAAGWVKGAELNFDARPTPNLHVRGAFGYLQSRYTSFPKQTVNYPRLGLSNATIDPTGNTFTRAPKLTASVGADYTFGIGAAGRIQVAADYRYLGHQYFSPTIEFDPTLENKGYGLASANLTWEIGRSGKYRLTGTVQNLTDQRYLIHSIAPSNNADSTRQGRPRSYLVSLYAKF